MADEKIVHLRGATSTLRDDGYRSVCGLTWPSFVPDLFSAVGPDKKAAVTCGNCLKIIGRKRSKRNA